MRPAIFVLPKPKIKTKRILAYLSVIALVGVLIGGFFWSWKAGRLPEINLGMLTARLAIETPEEEILRIIEEELFVEGLTVGAKVYEKTAEPGEGVTHLARKALKTHLEEKKTDFELTAEHKIYIEDYLRKNVGDRWLSLGEKVAFSEELIDEAVNAARRLTPGQLENLRQYSALVSSF